MVANVCKVNQIGKTRETLTLQKTTKPDVNEPKNGPFLISQFRCLLLERLKCYNAGPKINEIRTVVYIFHRESKTYKVIGTRVAVCHNKKQLFKAAGLF